MHEIVIISGKGGTGKTSLTGAFASLAGSMVLADCDVDAADLHLILEPQIRQRHNFSGGSQARIDRQACLECGCCLTACRFDAIHNFRIDPILCEGCGVCAQICPMDAIRFEPTINGEWYISDTRLGPMVHARLGIAEENSGKLVTEVRKAAKQIAHQQQADYLLVDGSPGIGCPVIASLSGAHLAVIVTEPTISGLHDLERVLDLTAHFGVAAAVIINKADINPGKCNEIENHCERRDIPVVGIIPYDESFTKAQTEKMTLIEYHNPRLSAVIEQTWSNIRARLQRQLS